MSFSHRARTLLAGLLLLSVHPTLRAQTLNLGEPNLQAGCDWVLAYDPAVPQYGNNAYPETRARYWFAAVSDTAPAGSRLRIEGQYPDARYSAFHVHDGNAYTLDALADYEIAPDLGSVIRLLSRTGIDLHQPYGGHYTAYVRINTAAPAVREPNTLYRKPPGVLDGKARKRTLIAYRTYLALGGNEGDVPLPKLTLETPNGDIPLPNPADAAACKTLESDFRKSSAGNLPLGIGIVIPPLVPVREPVFRKYDGSGMDTLGIGVGYNPHNGFMATKGDSSYGDALLVRVRLPTYTTQAQHGAAPLLRYWSLCENGANNTKVYGCLSDQDLAPDASGYATIVISADTAKPAYLTAARGFSWLNWGPDQTSAILIRELLAQPDWLQSIANAPTQQPETARGSYMPLATYCARTTLQQLAPQGAAAAFAACQANPLKRSGL